MKLTPPRKTRRMARAAALPTAVILALTSPLAAQNRSFAIEAEPIAQALRSFASQSGYQISMRSEAARGLRANPVRGEMAPETALRELLEGTGLTYDIRPDGVVVLSRPERGAEAAEPGSVLLDPVVLLAPSVGWDGTAEGVYEAGGDVDFIGSESLAKIPPSTAGDILRGTTGVLSGDSRSSGALNVNIRGLQGQGRAPVTVDGAQNSATAYRGYQGSSDRSFVDSDFIGSIAVTKGPDAGKPGIAGTVEVSTIGADEILAPGKTSGFRLRLGAGSNTSSPVVGQNQKTTGSQTSQTNPLRPNGPFNRPSTLAPTSGSASLIWATKRDWGEFLAGYSYRRQGNYFAGTHGPSANYEWMPCGEIEGVSMCPFRPNQWGNTGLSSYFAGEEVLNTSTENRSGLVKLGLDLSQDLRWNLGYNRFESKFGESFTRQYVYAHDRGNQRPLSKNTLQSATSELHYRPEGNDLIDLRWKLWATDLVSQSAASQAHAPISPTSLNLMWGSSLSNRSTFATGLGELRLDYGLSYQVEDTKPNEATRAVAGPGLTPPGVVNTNVDDGPLRDARRTETAGWINAELQATDRLKLRGGLRYTHASVLDRSTSPAAYAGKRSYDGFSPSLGLSYDLSSDLGLYVHYATALRHPSLLETSMAYGLSQHSNPSSEKGRTLDIGANWRRSALFAADDDLKLKLGYFRNQVDGYIGRGWEFDAATRTGRGLYFYNMDQAKFEGVYLNADYQRGGFNLGVSATYYTKVEFCPTAGACANRTSWADFASNHVPPKLQLAVDMSQNFMDDRLTLGARVSHVGRRAAGNEGSPPSNIYDLKMSMGVEWKPHTIFDLYGNYALSDTATINFGIQNVTDKYYIDPLVTGRTPAPGRTASISVDLKF